MGLLDNLIAWHCCFVSLACEDVQTFEVDLATFQSGYFGDLARTPFDHDEAGSANT
jgi:hypothetical protein